MKELNKLQNAQLSILKDVIDFCEDYGLTYFLIAGSLLGSIRHNGFIPWDDDIDIAMSRRDYDIFEKCFVKSNKCNKYTLQSYNTEKNYYQPFSKVRLNGSQFIEKTSEHLDMHHGIFLDVFILDNTFKKDSIKTKIQAKTHKLFSSILWYKYIISYKNNMSYKETLITNIIKLVPINVIKKLQLWNLNKYNNSESQYLCNFGCQYGYKKNVYQLKDYYPPNKQIFENIVVNVPNNYKKILETMYGDYLKIPSKEKRVTHNPVKIKYPND